jgi:hypothetical protein
MLLHGLHPFGTKVWNLLLPRKMCNMFLWRFAHNGLLSLGLGVNLRRQGLEVDTICPLCRRLDEDSGHLPEFKYTKSIRKEANLEDSRTPQSSSWTARRPLLSCFPYLQIYKYILPFFCEHLECTEWRQRRRAAPG